MHESASISLRSIEKTKLIISKTSGEIKYNYVPEK
jgi:hypothetical protein